MEQARALGADRVLERLYHERFAFGDQAFDGPGIAVLFAEDIGDVQEGSAFEAHLDEGRLHAGQHAHDAAEKDVADDAAPAGAFDVQLLHGALQHLRDARFLWREIDEKLFIHSGYPNSRNSSAVSHNGRPTMPEWLPWISAMNIPACP